MHARETQSQKTCVMRGSCAGPMASLAVLLPGHAVPAEPVAFLPDLPALGGVDPARDNPIGHPAPPDTPPPRA